MEMEKSKVLIQFLSIFKQSGKVLFSQYARRLRGYTATVGIVDSQQTIETSEHGYDGKNDSLFFVMQSMY